MKKESALLVMKQRHLNEIDELRKNCDHRPSYLKKVVNFECVGRGCLQPAVSIICRNCGTERIILDLDTEKIKTVKKTLKKQGFKNEMLLR